MKLNIVGKNIIRVDAQAKVTGKALYPQDIYLDNMVYGKTVRSTKPHAYIKIDISEAEKVDGVLKVFTYKDIPNKNAHGVVLKDHEAFASKKVIRIGEPIAFIVAETQKICEEAYKKIKIDYEEIPAVFDPVEAMKEDAPKVHGDSNIIYHFKLRHGDIEEGKRKSKYIVENIYKSPMVEHAFLQPEAGLGYLEEDGTVVVVIATQYPHYDREEVAINLGLPEEKVKIINTNVGGAFGGREDISAQIHLALAAMVLKRPVKVIFSREESFLAHSKRHPMIMKYKTGADENGYLQYMEAEIIGDSGAHCSWAMNVLRKAGVHATGPYVIPHVKVDAYAVYTNNPYTGAMRGFGATQVPIAHEQQMDALAEKLGMNPIEFRMKNIFRRGSMTATGQILTDSVPLDRCLEAVDERFKFSQLWKEVK
ncbi:MAG: molybdopterin-dependent oxidoreductase [Tissierellia bacterium]|nr:molybdopterin-dependent oxidoreductase [Tissierellia bacterium]